MLDESTRVGKERLRATNGTDRLLDGVPIETNGGQTEPGNRELRGGQSIRLCSLPQTRPSVNF